MHNSPILYYNIVLARVVLLFRQQQTHNTPHLAPALALVAPGLDKVPEVRAVTLVEVVLLQAQLLVTAALVAEERVLV